MWQGKLKAITFSYDDGCDDDKKIIEIFDKYHIKGTFNLNSAMFGSTFEVKNPEGGIIESIPKIKKEDVKKTYVNHEVAVHTLTHPNLVNRDDDTVLKEIVEDKKNLEKIIGKDVVGMAYPSGGINNDLRVRNIVKTKTNIQYARTITSTYSFDLQTDLLEFNPTIWHGNKDLWTIVDRFLELKSDKPQLLYIWGHAFELNKGHSFSWEKLERLCQIISNKSDVFYGTNKDVLLDK